jgi:transposase
MIGLRPSSPIACRGMEYVVSMQPRPWPEVPESTARAAKAAFPRGNLAIRIRDELGQVYADERFASAFAVRGKPAISPGQLMMAVVLQFTENLSDRQAADAVRDRLSWKYALGLELDDPGFDASVLSEFRGRLVEHELTGAALDLLLERLGRLGLVKAGGRARTDSTHVLAAVRSLNRLELAGETLRAALEALAAAAPDWLTGLVDADWVIRYGARVDSYRLPEAETKRSRLAVQIGVDGYALLDAVHAATAPGWLRELPAVGVLRQVWIQQYYRVVGDGRQEVARREADDHGLPPGRARLVSCYDTDARYSIKRDHGWQGYKVHFTETCHEPVRDDDPGLDQADPPNLITNVATTEATVPDAKMTEPIHRQLAAKNLLPDEHLLDSGYPSAELVVASLREFGVRLVTPVLLDTSPQAAAGGGYDKTAFTINWDAHQATCPQGVASASWSPCTQRGDDAVVVKFPADACRPCPVRAQCTTAKRGGRQLTLRSRELHEALTHARAEQTSDQWKASYAARAGVEGTMHQAVAVTGTRHARYTGLPKTQLEHNIAAAAINLIRLDAHWTGKPIDRGRTSHLARLDFTLAA